VIAGGKQMKVWGLGAVMLLTILALGCSSNSTPVAVTVVSTGASPMSVLVNNSVPFAANVSGVSATTVFWQICKPTTTPQSTTIPPTDCTQGQGGPQCTIPTVTAPLTGFGTITPNGLYTAPGTPPTPNGFLIVATSCVKSTAFGTFTVIIDTGTRVQIIPSTATLGTQETFQFTATVSGNPNASVTWSVCQSGGANGGLINCTMSSPSLGSITGAGSYAAPINPISVVIQAISNADATQSATAIVSVGPAVPPALTAIDPTAAAEGSVQQDVYLTGTGFLSTTGVTVNGVAVPSANVTLLSATLIRVTLPAAQLAQAGNLTIVVNGQTDGSANPGGLNLSVVAVRPSVVASSPDSVSQNNNLSPNLILTGGFFSTSATTATFNGATVPATVNSSRQLFLSIPSGDLGSPGLYPIFVRNSGVTPGQPSMAALNLAVTPNPLLIPQAPVPAGPISVGSTPSAVAVDEAHGRAVVANTGDNTVSLVNLLTHAVSGSITVGNKPTGVTVDDLLADPVALVVCNTDQTVWAIDLTSGIKTNIGVSISAGVNPPLPFSIGVNPITHRAIVAYQSTDEATILHVSVSGGTPALSVVQQVGGAGNLYSTGASPAIAIDPRLNWAVVTPGGAGTTNIVDLGEDASTGEPQGRAPQLIGNISISTSVQGVGINTETHKVLLTDPNTGLLTTFSLLDNSVTTVTLAGNAGAFHQTGFSAAAVTPLENLGVAVSANSIAVIVDLENSSVLQTVTGLGTSPLVQAVAVDPVSNQAIVVNQGDGTVSILSLGPAINPMQIVESGPEIAFTSSASLPLTVTGGNFPPTSSVRLDQTPVVTNPVAATCTTAVPITCRQLIATVPASMLASARRFSVDVQNPGGTAVSNVTDLTVIQPVTVGTAPVGVAVDTDRDLAVVTNSDDGTVSLVALTPETPTGPTATPAGMVGQIGSPITVGTTPEGVAVISRLGLALIANNGSNDATVVDVTQTIVPATVHICTSGCTGPTGVAIDQDSGVGVVTATNPGSVSNLGTVVTVSLTATPPVAGATVSVDPDPVAVAIDPEISVLGSMVGYAAVATASSASSVDFINLATAGLAGRTSNLENPSGIVFDPVNQVFLTANGLLNEVVIIDPTTFIATAVPVGIGPTSLDYNFQTSTLLTVNSVSHTLSVISYVCPFSIVAPSCLGPRVRTVLDLGGTQTSTPVLGPNAVAVDPKLNLAVLVDEDNNRVLLVPLP
jgi:YVTN family beta-propeller protein